MSITKLFAITTNAPIKTKILLSATNRQALTNHKPITITQLKGTTINNAVDADHPSYNEEKCAPAMLYRRSV